MVILGMGCDRGTSLQTLETAVEQALSVVELRLEHVNGLATIDKKSDEIGLLALAEKNQWPLHFFPADILKTVPVPNPSAVVMKYMGTPAVAEAAAMLAAKTNIKNLILEKHKYLGDDKKNATVSIARIENESR